MIKTGYLDNGIFVITDSVSSADTVSLGMWVGTGSRFETERNNGISHVLEHMAFKGTKTRTALEISESIENVGGIINAYTGHSITAYYAKVLSENTSVALDIIMDILQNSVFDETELNKEKGVIIQEIKMNNDTPDDFVFDLFSKTAYPDQALGRPIAGKPEIISSISSQDLFSYMKSHYTTKRMVISASGKINHDDFINQCNRLLVKKFNSNSSRFISANYVGGDCRLKKDIEQVNLILGFNSLSYQDPHYYDLSVFSVLFGGGMSSRLIQEIREKRGLVYSIYTHNWTHQDTGVFTINAGTGEKEVSELMPVLCDEILNACEHLNEPEIERAKTQLKAHILMRNENISTHAELNAFHWLHHNRLISKKEILGKINQVNSSTILPVVQRIFSTSPTFSCLGPIQYVLSYEDLVNRLKK